MQQLELTRQLELQNASFKTELEKQKSENMRMHEIRSYYSWKKVRIRWTVTYQDLKCTRRQINAISVFGPGMWVHCWRVAHLMYMIGCRLKMRRIKTNYDAFFLKKNDMSERGFRKKFRYGRSEKSEMFIQSSSRLKCFLKTWLNMAKVDKSFEAVCDFTARDQFLESCSRELYVHLKPKALWNVDEMAREADLFAEARRAYLAALIRDNVRVGAHRRVN